MGRSHISPKLTVPTWSAFRRHCHRFLAIGYQEALTRIKNDPDEETDITGYICEALEDWFRVNPQESFLFFIKEDPPLSGSSRTGRRRLRTDIILSYAAGKRPEFIFEAKRLHRTKAIASRYTGEAGMGCFTSGRYASQCHEAAMIGYVQSDTLEHWQTTLRSKIEANRFELKVDSIDKRVSFGDSFPLEWSSSHRREAMVTVRLFHILLDCRK
jgi:hypothetical protein